MTEGFSKRMARIVGDENSVARYLLEKVGGPLPHPNDGASRVTNTLLSDRVVCRCGDCTDCLSPLPAGESCASACVHIARCKALLGQKGDERACQFVPSRFAPLVHGSGQ